MKCVKHKDSGKITRITNELADALVNADTAEFIRKEEWKKAGRP